MKISFYNEQNDRWYFNVNVKLVSTITAYDTFVASVDYNDGTFIDIYRSPEGNLIGKKFIDD